MKARPSSLKRVAIENVTPRVGNGEFPARRAAGELVTVEADVFADGTDAVVARVAFSGPGEDSPSQIPMAFVENDRWRTSFAVPDPGRYRFSVLGWTDPIRSWREALRQRVQGGVAEPSDLRDGVALLRELSRGERGRTRHRFAAAASQLEQLVASDTSRAIQHSLDPSFWSEMPDWQPPEDRVSSSPELEVQVDPASAGARAWYELFPRSCSPVAGRSGTFGDVLRRIPALAELGFDTVYLPPIHPIGRTHRRGPNNSPAAGPADPGSPWAIGSSEGGHTAVHPELGTLVEFQELVTEARRHGVELALDLAFQCSPDHPWVREHPEWFRHRADGTIRTAENPPKRYDDIFPLDFESEDAARLWEALLEVVEFWVERGVRRFRVDNPHTKSFEFWAWLIARVRAEHPEVLFLAEAFTRPKVMFRLAKLGFTHSYTYFAWRNSKTELTDYFEELYGPELREYFRPHLWPNTPDILTEYLQTGGRPAFIARLVLAATLSPNYGIYGPAFEWMLALPQVPGKEEYRDSEKYQVRHWDLVQEAPLAPVLRRVNKARQEQPVLRSSTPPVFQRIDNPSLLGFSRYDPSLGRALLVFVNLDPHHVQAGLTDLDLGRLGVSPNEPFQVHDQLVDRSWTWRGPRNYVELRPQEMPAHVFVLGPGG